MEAATTFIDVFQGSNVLELVCDNPKGHLSDFAPSIRKRNSSGSISPVAAPKKKLQHCRWDSSSSSGCNSTPVKPAKTCYDSPPSLKRMISPPPSCLLQNVLKPVRRRSLENQLDAICGTRSDKNMTTAEILSSVLNELDLLDEEDSMSVED